MGALIIKVKKMHPILNNFNADDDVYVVRLEEHKVKIFNHFTIGENGSTIQLPSFAKDNPGGIARITIDVPKYEGSLSYLIKKQNNFAIDQNIKRLGWRVVCTCFGYRLEILFKR